MKTNDEKLAIGQNAFANYILKPFKAQNEKDQMLLARQTTNRGQVKSLTDTLVVSDSIYFYYLNWYYIYLFIYLFGRC